MTKVLTFDLGTSYFKVCLFDESLRLVAHQRVPAPVSNAASGRSEILIPEFERCLATTVLQLSHETGGLGEVKYISFASQANSFTFLDAANRPLTPFVLWTDQRARNLSSVWDDFTRTPRFKQTTGVTQFDHHFMLPKIEWFRQQQPAVLENARQLCGMSDFLVWWLTGTRAAEVGLVGLTGLLDIKTCQYWEDARQLLDIPASWLQPLVRAGTDLGPIRSRFVETWGLPPDCRVIMGCLDQYAGAIGAGVVEPGDVCETTGTVLATVTCAHDLIADADGEVFQGPSFTPGLYYRMAFSRVGAGLLEKYRNALPDRPSFAELDMLAAKVPSGAAGLKLRSNAPDLPVGEMFCGKTQVHKRGHEVRAIMEAVAAELRAQVSALCKPQWPQVVRSVGGAARSHVWQDIKAETLGCSIEAVDCAETTSLGAAELTVRQSKIQSSTKGTRHI